METMNVFLKMVSAELGAKGHAILVMDGAGWHKSRALKVPGNITILILPPYSPELIALSVGFPTTFGRRFPSRVLPTIGFPTRGFARLAR